MTDRASRSSRPQPPLHDDPIRWHDAPIRWMVLHYGRAYTWAILALLLANFIMAIFFAQVIYNTRTFISPQQSQVEGCCTVEVRVLDFGRPVQGGRYKVETLTGRRPTTTDGEWSDGRIQIMVGRDWVGRVQVEVDRYCSGSFWSPTEKKWTELIGGSYGFNRRDIGIHTSC